MLELAVEETWGRDLACRWRASGMPRLLFWTASKPPSHVRRRVPQAPVSVKSCAATGRNVALHTEPNCLSGKRLRARPREGATGLAACALELLIGTPGCVAEERQPPTLISANVAARAPGPFPNPVVQSQLH